MKMRRGAQVLSVGLALSLLAAACGGDEDSAGSGGSATAVNCPGEPVKLLVAVNLTGPTAKFPEAVEGAQAAAQAINTSCDLGRPIEILECDEKLSPNEAAACARKGVTENVVAAAGTITGFGDSYMPVLEEAGIPSVGNIASSQSENTSQSSFPTVNSLAVSTGTISAAASAGVTKLHLVGLDLPAISFIFDMAKAQAAKVGVEIVGETFIPVEASDVTQYAAQITSSGADGVGFVLDGTHVLQVLKSLKQQGVDPDKIRLVTGSVATRPAEVDENLEATEGIYLTGPAWPSTDETNPGIKQYLAELEAIDAEAPTSDVGVNAWSTVHIIADLLKGAPTMDSATLVERLTSAGPIARPELGAVDFSKPAFPDNPVLSQFRAFGKQHSISRVIDGVVTPVVSEFADVEEKATLTG